MPRFISRGFSDQTCVPKDIHDKTIQEIMQKLKIKFGNNFADTEFKGVEDDIQITIFNK